MGYISLNLQSVSVLLYFAKKLAIFIIKTVSGL